MTETATESSESTSIESPIALEATDQIRATHRRRAALLVLGLALVWIACIRLPLILNVRAHLDSDLAVDGITLREATQGHWRWHYPATPHIGIIPVLYSLPQALIWGATPITLVSGGTVAYALLVAATFALTWVVFGRRVALWGLIPLTFASTGAIWLSGRITGGHLSAAIWHAIAFLLLYQVLVRSDRRIAVALGIWCGLGLYVDTMFVLTLAGLVPAAFGSWWRSGRSRSGLLATLLFGLGFLVGVAPREIGARLDPHNAYQIQLLTNGDSRILLNHLRILGLDCLPRLIAGHRLPDLQSDPSPWSLGEAGPNNGPRDTHPLAIAVTVVILVVFLVSSRALADPESTRGDRAAAAVRWGLLISSVATLVVFVAYSDISNSDNYRYLVNLLVPWSIGFGLAMHSLAQLGRAGQVIACLCGATVAVLMTLDTARWYQQFGWCDAMGRPIVVEVRYPPLDWLNEHPEVQSIQTSYWDAYRLSFLANRPIIAIPYPIFPDRFPEWSRRLPRGHPDYVIGRRLRMGHLGTDSAFRAREAGGELLHQSESFYVISWP